MPERLLEHRVIRRVHNAVDDFASLECSASTPGNCGAPRHQGWRLIYAWSSGLRSASEADLLGHFEKLELPIHITRSKGCLRVMDGRMMKHHWMSVPDRILVLVGGGTEAASPSAETP